MIGYIFDEQGSPVSAAGAFMPQVADAVLYFALRGESSHSVRLIWRSCFSRRAPADTPREMREQTEAAILKYARQRPIIATRTR